MAIITEIPGFEAKVMVDGEPAEEYLDGEHKEPERTVTRYIEATSGAQFSVECTLKKPFQHEKTDISLNFYVDGNWVDSSVYRQRRYRGSESILYQMDGMVTFEDGNNLKKPLFFSDISLDENNGNISLQKDKFKSLGEIRVCIHRGIARRSTSTLEAKPFDSADQVPEKALKGQALSHQTRLGEAQMMKPRSLYSFDSQNGKGRDASFVFRYRSRDALQAGHIIPRTPPPTPREDRPLEELTTEELRDIQRSVAQTATKRETKLETKLERVLDDDSDLEITQVRSRKRQRISTSTEVIDLCGD